MDPVIFNFDHPKDIYPTLQRCSIASVGTSTTLHLAPLQQLAERLAVSNMTLQNTEYAGRGYDDLAIVLIEPSDREDWISHDDIMADKDHPSTMRYLDNSLQLAFRGKRDFRNTIVLDTRPFRSHKIKKGEAEYKRKENNAAAYAALEDSLDILRPKIIVVCNCDHGSVEDGLPPYLCTSVERAGETELVQLPNKHQCIKVSSFHPMYIERTNPDQRTERIMREYLFDACLVVAARLLVGRTIFGSGIFNIRHAAIWGPIIVPGRSGPTLSYKCATEDDIASETLIKDLKKLGLLGNPGDPTVSSEETSVDDAH
ncbi:hypothetical protein FOPG_17792 [Fusarium oxysporum f. sp. conglutinans race 2 54008]|nr:hypothetical protein FOPG_17792 [Fusarium oxysporum f. sp. conglutinans race 2 54008]